MLTSDTGHLRVDDEQGFTMILWSLVVFLSVLAQTRGREPEIERIVAGMEAERDEFPFLVAVKRDGEFRCSGVIVKPDVIVTAASCVHYYGYDVPDIHIVAGEFNLEDDDGSEQTGIVTTIEIHPEYDDFTRLADVALLYLAKELVMGPYVQTVERVADSEDEVKTLVRDSLCFVPGWGWTLNDKGIWSGEPSAELQKIITSRIDNGYCQATTPYTGPITAKKICSRNEEGGPCVGDIGSPLMCQVRRNVWVMMGSFSQWGRIEGCRRGTSIFTSSAYFRDWITGSGGVSMDV